MTELELRQKVVAAARAYKGVQKGTAKHQEIVDTYNSYQPRPRGHRLTTSDNWCAAFVSAMAIKLGLTEIMPVECSCTEFIKLYSALGRWEERDDYKPAIGDLVIYDWEDGKNYATTDNKAAPNHVGIVCNVSGNLFTVIEGNKGAASVVGERSIAVNGRYIRGFCLPDYARAAEADEETVSLPRLLYGDRGEEVKALQTLLNLRGASLEFDGSFGLLTTAAVKAFQRRVGLDETGVVTVATWKKLIEG